MKQFLCELLFSCLLAAPAARGIDELSYGTALYAYHQQDYAQGLLEVLVAERQQRLGDDPVRFELAKGSFAFQEGMYRYAADTFAAVDPAELTDLDRMRLAFHLAREHHRRGDWPAMEQQLAVIDLGANWRGRSRHHPEVSFLRAEGALARGDFAAAEASLAELDGADDELAYGLFNLGVAQRESGDLAAAEDAFRRLGALRVRTPAAWDLVQRGRLALAVLSRERGEVVTAEALLASLPGEGRYRDLALASYGRLAMARDDHALAGRIWLTLIQRGTWSASHAEAHLGLPASLERMDAEAQALDRYRRAEAVFAGRLEALDVAAGRARDPQWVRALLAVAAPAQPADGAAPADADPLSLDAGLGLDTWLEWLASESVHGLLTEWRELDGMATWLDTLPDHLGALEQVAAERHRRSAAAREMLAAEALTERRDAIRAQTVRLAADLTAIGQSAADRDPDWMRRLATPEELPLIDRLDAMAAAASAAGAAERARLQGRIDRLQGLVFWQVADEQAARVRALRKRLADAEALLAEADARIERLAEAEGRFAAGVVADFRALNGRATAVSRQVAAARAGRERALAEALERGVEQDRERTRQYLLATRVAIARTTDRLAAAAAPASAGDS
ncbi:MAG: hypothetical protein ACN6I7_01240 [bacterium]